MMHMHIPMLQAFMNFIEYYQVIISSKTVRNVYLTFQFYIFLFVIDRGAFSDMLNGPTIKKQ